MSALTAEFLIHLGQAVKERRVALNMIQDDVAFEAGFDRSYVSDVERGEQNITISTLWKLSRCLDIPISKLMRRAEATYNSRGKPGAGRRNNSSRPRRSLGK